MGTLIAIHGTPNFSRKGTIIKKRKSEYSEAIDIYSSIKSISLSEKLLMHLSNHIAASVGMLISAEVSSNKNPQ